MNSFIPCAQCSHSIHESATACPKCGAPNTAVSSIDKVIYSSYAEVPWYRKRWFAVVCTLVFIPLLLLLAFTGDFYYQKDGNVKTFSKNYKFFMLAIFVGMVLLNLASS